MAATARRPDGTATVSTGVSCICGFEIFVDDAFHGMIEYINQLEVAGLN